MDTRFRESAARVWVFWTSVLGTTLAGAVPLKEWLVTPTPCEPIGAGLRSCTNALGLPAGAVLDDRVLGWGVAIVIAGLTIAALFFFFRGVEIVSAFLQWRRTSAG